MIILTYKRANLDNWTDYYKDLIDTVPDKYKRYWEWFFAFSRIPRQSWNHEFAPAQTKKWLLEIGIPEEAISIDEAPNVLARIPASPGLENAPTICVQAHMDVAMHYTAEKLPYKVKLEDDWFIAYESLLGADDGVGIAWMLLTAEERDLFKHGPIELLFTSDEEVGLVGMNYLPGPNEPGGLKAKDIINIDFFDADKFAYASAGSIRFEINGTRTMEQVSSDQFRIIQFNITGMIGGHSGMNMINGRPTPQDWIARCMFELISNSIEFRINHYLSGDASNVLPVNGEIQFAVPAHQYVEACQLIKKHYEALVKQYEQVKLSQSSFSISEVDPESDTFIGLSREDSINFIDSIFGMFHGILYFVDKAIYTSVNVAKITLTKTTDTTMQVQFQIMPRTHIQGHLDYMRQRVDSFMRVYRMDGFRELATSDPWNGDPESPLAMTFRESYRSITGEEIEPVVFHAGVEAGKFQTRGYTDANVINFGADTKNAHTIGESVKVSTTNTKTDVFRLFLQRFADPSFQPPSQAPAPKEDQFEFTPLLGGVIGAAVGVLASVLVFIAILKFKSNNRNLMSGGVATPLL